MLNFLQSLSYLNCVICRKYLKVDKCLLTNNSYSFHLISDFGTEFILEPKMAFVNKNLRLNKNERAKCVCLQCLSKWEVQTWYMAPCQNCLEFGLLLKFVSCSLMRHFVWNPHFEIRNSPGSLSHPILSI